MTGEIVFGGKAPEEGKDERAAYVANKLLGLVPEEYRDDETRTALEAAYKDKRGGTSRMKMELIMALVDNEKRPDNLQELVVSIVDFYPSRR